MNKIEKHIVINFDLGLKGDYQNLYAWLDNKKAIECGNSTAAFAMVFSEDDFQIIYDELKNEINSHVEIKPTDRVYMIATSHGKMKGQFLFGGRRRAIWDGYGIKQSIEPDTF